MTGDADTNFAFLSYLFVMHPSLSSLVTHKCIGTSAGRQLKCAWLFSGVDQRQKLFMSLSEHSGIPGKLEEMERLARFDAQSRSSIGRHPKSAKHAN